MTRMWIARGFAAKFGMASYCDFDGLRADKAMDIVALNTLPPSYAALNKATLHAGKHVFCENHWRLLSLMPRLCSTGPGNKGSLTFPANFIAIIHPFQVKIRHVY